MTIGLGIAPGESEGSGIPSTVRNIALEGLVAFGFDGRSQSRLADAAQSSVSSDGLTWHLKLRSGATFHDGQPVTASSIRDVLMDDLPGYMGPAFDDVQDIRASSDTELTFVLKRRSTLLIESLDLSIQKPGDPPVGTGPFHAADSIKGRDEVEMLATRNYYAGKPLIDRLIIRRYPSVRAAWADMLRGRVDMLYDVGIDALDSLQPSTHTKIFTFRRPYVYAVILNTTRPTLRDKAFRRALNTAIDREALVTEALRGHGVPAEGPLLPTHWAYDPSSFRPFRYEPRSLKGPIQFTCIYVDRSHERIALALQKQLQAIGVDLMLEQLSTDAGLARLQSGDFDAALIDVGSAPTMSRTFVFWYSGSPYNFGRFSSRAVDSALDTVRHASDDAEYKAGVAAFQRAIVDDPPAIFLAWSERARAVSTRFEVPAEPGRDILSTLRLWRPVADKRMTSPN